MFPRNLSNSSSHASIAETGRTASSPSRRDSRNRAPAPSLPSGPNKFPAATADRGSATAATCCRASHSTEISTPRPFQLPSLTLNTLFSTSGILLEVPGSSLLHSLKVNQRKKPNRHHRLLTGCDMNRLQSASVLKTEPQHLPAKLYFAALSLSLMPRITVKIPLSISGH
jgi:hypothetical protein